MTPSWEQDAFLYCTYCGSRFMKHGCPNCEGDEHDNDNDEEEGDE